MKNRLAIPFVMGALLVISRPVQATSICLSAFTAEQLHELDVLVFPDRPYSPHLTEALEGDPAQGAVRRLTQKETDGLRGAIARPFTGAVGNVRPAQDATLKKWFNSIPSAEFPAWTPQGDTTWVPQSWIGRTADAFIHLMQESGTAGRLKTATLGSTASRGHTIGVTQHTDADAAGRDIFLWTYIYRTTIDGELLTTLLAICEADIVTMSIEERDVRGVEHELARAWEARDRPTIDRLLAREWAVTMPDGTTVSRAALLDATFNSGSRIVERMAIDDDELTVLRFDATAVVRGRATTTIAISGRPETTSVRFTDVLIKGDGGWQIVASHQTLVAR